MQDLKYRWFPHLEGAVPLAGQGKGMSTYNIALEGWRRGLDLVFYSYLDEENKLKIRYSLSSVKKTHKFLLSQGDKVSDEAISICANKELTKRALSKANVPVPNGKMFESDVKNKDIIAFAKSVGFPIVVKPTCGDAGKGVFANIKNINSLRWVLDHVRNELGYYEVIVEKFCPGEEYRVYVINDSVIAAMNRRPASVLGDGTHSIMQLINIKNSIRKSSPHLSSHLIKVDREVEDVLSRASYQLESIPKDGERVYLRQKSNISAGGDTIDVTEEITSELKNIAISAGKGIPGLVHYGVDMIVDTSKKKGVILEVNTRPGVGGHLFPMEGKPRDLPKHIIDFYFPETKDKSKTNLYFDFDSIQEAIQSGSVDSISVTPPLTDKVYSKKYIVSGQVQKDSYRKYIKKYAQLHRLNGFVENAENGNIAVVVAGTDQEVVNHFEKNCLAVSTKATVNKIVASKWTKPVKLGFEIKNEFMTKQQALRLADEKNKIEKEKDSILKKYTQIANSRTWKIMSPVRFTSGLLKKLLDKN